MPSFPLVLGLSHMAERTRRAHSPSFIHVCTVRRNTFMSQKALVILGSQWGDEGKGKIVDLLAERVDLVCRTGGGSNAGASFRV